MHHGFCDISMLSVLPNAVIIGALDEPSLKGALEFMASHDAGLSSVRYPRDSVSDRFTKDACPPFELGKARALPDVVELFGKTGGAVNTMGLGETEAFVKREAERWGKLVREAGVTAE